MPLTDSIKILDAPPSSVPKALETTAKEITAILTAGKKYEGKEAKSTCKYLDLIIVVRHVEEPTERLIVTPGDPFQSVMLHDHVKALPKLAEQLDQYLKLKHDTRELKGNRLKTEIHGFLNNQNKSEEKWTTALGKINALLLDFHTIALNEQREKELAELRATFNKIIGKDSQAMGVYQKVKKEVSDIKAADGEKNPATLPLWIEFMGQIVLPDQTVEAAVKKTFIILKTFVTYSVDPNERQEAALACAILARYQFKQKAEIYGYFYCIAMDMVAKEEVSLFAVYELNKFIFAEIKSCLGVVVKDKLKARNVNCLCLIDSEFFSSKKLATLIPFLLNHLLVLPDEKKLNILLNTLLDTAYMLNPANETDVAQGYGHLSHLQLEALQKMLPAAIAKKARDLIASKYSASNYSDKKAKQAALQTLADRLDFTLTAATATAVDEKNTPAKDSKVTVSDTNTPFAARIVDAVNAATLAALEHPDLFSGRKGLFTKGTGSETRDIFQLLLTAADVLNRNKLVGLRNAKLREFRGEKPSALTAAAVTKHGGPLGGSALASKTSAVAAAVTKQAVAVLVL